MDDSNGSWVALFSGGKDSSWALHRALEAGLDVRRLVLVRPPEGSHAYHAPAPSVARAAARSVGIPIVDAGLPAADVEPPDLANAGAGRDVDGDVESLADVLRAIDDDLEDGLAGIVVGAITSDHQVDRLRALCDRLKCEVVAPLWQADPRELAAEMIDGGLEVAIVEVAGPGFDERWLGRRLDREALGELAALSREFGIHLLGENGEFETVATDGPHMSRPVALEYEREWNGDWGQARITDVRLE